MNQSERKIYSYGEGSGPGWAEFIDAMYSGEEVEIDTEMFYYWLEVLPPIFMGKTVLIDGIKLRVDFGFAEGAERITYFYTTPDQRRFFCRRSTVINPG